MNNIVQKRSQRNLYLVGKIRFMETKLFDSSGFNRFIENNTRKEFLEELSDTHYQKFIEDEEFERGIQKYIYSVYRYFYENMDDRNSLKVFMMHQDIQNFINYIKQISDDELISPGVFGDDWIKKQRLPDFFKSVMYEIQKISEGKEPGDIPDRMIEKICMDILDKKYASEIENKNIRNFWKEMIDIKNMLKKVNHPEPKYYFKGGSIKESFWNSADLSQGIPEKIKSKRFYKVISAKEDKIQWGTELRKWKGKVLKQMRKATFGVEPIVSFFLSIREEFINLKIVYAGIDMEMDKKEIKEKICTAYV